MTEDLLVVENAVKNFGGLQAVAGASFRVRRGQILALIGPNGAGKSTVLNCIAGELSLDEGRILLEGQELHGGVPHQVARRGIVRTYQLPREWAQLTVMENLLAAPYPQLGERLAYALFLRARVFRQEAELLRRARELLRFFRLYDLRNERAAHLSGGQKKLLELARAMMTQPKLLLLDEPTAGVNPVLVQRIVDHIREIRDAGVTIVIVEHNLSVVESISDEVVVMASGSVLTTGSMEDIRKNPKVIEAYLGGGYTDATA